VDTFAEAATTGFNGNMCRVLADQLNILGGSEFEYSMAWSPYWPVPAELQRVRAVRVGPENRDLLIEAATELQFIEPREIAAAMNAATERLMDGPAIIIGLVTHLHSERVGRHNSRDIVVKEDGSERRVHVELDDDSYRMACDAHRDGRPVRVEGSLSRMRGLLVLNGVTSLRLS
jgi:hypothetical protein